LQDLQNAGVMVYLELCETQACGWWILSLSIFNYTRCVKRERSSGRVGSVLIWFLALAALFCFANRISVPTHKKLVSGQVVGVISANGSPVPIMQRVKVSEFYIDEYRHRSNLIPSKTHGVQYGLDWESTDAGSGEIWRQNTLSGRFLGFEGRYRRMVSWAGRCLVEGCEVESRGLPAIYREKRDSGGVLSGLRLARQVERRDVYPRSFIQPERAFLLVQLPLQELNLLLSGNRCVGRVLFLFLERCSQDASLLGHFPELLPNKIASHTSGYKSEEGNKDTQFPITNGLPLNSAEFIIFDDSDKQWLWNGVWFSCGLWLCWLCWLCGEFTPGDNGFNWSDRLYRRLSGHGFSDRERVLISFACFIGGLVLCSHAIINCTPETP